MPELERPHNSDETISNLHHMSTTAGMGAGEYVEINPVSIASIILAIMSLLGIAFLPFLLLGLLAVGSGVFALVKIRRSNGTQGGRLIAILGITLSILISGGEGVRQWMIHTQNQADSQAINASVQQLGDHLAKRDFAKARNMFGKQFQDKITLESFSEIFKSICGIVEYGEFQGLEANGTFSFTTLGDGTRVGSTIIQARFEKKYFDFARMDAIKDEDGNWVIYNIPGIFPAVPPIQ